MVGDKAFGVRVRAALSGLAVCIDLSLQQENNDEADNFAKSIR